MRKRIERHGRNRAPSEPLIITPPVIVAHEFTPKLWIVRRRKLSSSYGKPVRADLDEGFGMSSQVQ